MSTLILLFLIQQMFLHQLWVDDHEDQQINAIKKNIYLYSKDNHLRINLLYVRI